MRRALLDVIVVYVYVFIAVLNISGKEIYNYCKFLFLRLAVVWEILLVCKACRPCFLHLPIQPFGIVAYSYTSDIEHRAKYKR